MTRSADLLRLLEPTVRPVATPNPGVKPAATAGDAPFEQQDFATLLDSARQDASADPLGVDDPTATADAKPAGPLDPLADIGRIENPGLRELLASRAATLKTGAQDPPNLAA